MSTNLYETLGVHRDATEDQIRKAYKKRALQTHPDRVPPEQKETAGDEFRKVNNAYEVLNDPTKRRAYDAAGVWPPPPPGSGGSRHRRRPRYSSPERHAPYTEEPFFDFGWNHAGFTDPFSLFESVFGSVFGELHNSMSDPFFPDPWRRGRGQPFDVNRQRSHGFFDDHLLNAGFPFDRGFDDMTNPGRGRARVYSQVSHSTVTPDGRFLSESRMSRTVNGVTESVWKRKDAAGNEYATYTYPGGRERHTINGREQPPKHIQPQRFQPSPSPSPPPPIQTTLPPPPPYSNMSRKRESPTSVSGGKRHSPIREHHIPIEIQSSSHSGSPPPPIRHHYRPPPTTVHDYAYAHETPHHKSRSWWKK